MSPSAPEVVANVVVSHPAVTRPAAPRDGARAGAAATCIAIGSAAALGAAWGAPLMAKMVGDADFPFHVAAAEHFASTGAVTVPHFLLQVLLGSVLATGVFGSASHAGFLFFCGLYAATAAAICWYVARDSRSRGALVASVILVSAVMLAAPVLPRGEPTLFLIGYFPPNVYHNPTMLMAKPWLVLSFACAVAAVTRVGRCARGELLLLVVPVVLLGLAKPNYLGCLVPVLLAGAAWAAARRRPISWARVIAVCASALATLASTYLLYESEELGFDAGIIFAPLEVIALYAPVDTASIVGRLAGSLAFPLIVAVMWPRAAAADVGLRTAWSAALVALFYSYFLAEGGGRLDHGNFLWTGQMGVFVLFVAAAAFVRQRLQLSSPSAVMFGRTLAIGVVLLFHVESGLRHVALKIDLAQWLAFWT